MKIDGTLPSSPWSDLVSIGKPGSRNQISGIREDSSKVDQSDSPSEDAKELSASKNTYSPASLKLAAARNALVPEVAQNNINAANHAAPLPRLVVDQINQLISQR